MKHCPECNVEYMDTATRCSDCDVELTLGPPIPEIPEEHPDPGVETVYTAEDPVLVARVESLLEEAGIEYFIKRPGGYITFPLLGFVVAGKDAPTARELLAHLEDALPDEPWEEEPGP
jgi:hypothetical protein